MKLAEYLADYIEHEQEGHLNCIIDGDMLQQGIEAFESTEGWVVLVVSEETAERIRELSE